MAPRAPYILVAFALACLLGLGCGSDDSVLLPDPARTSGTVGTVVGAIRSGGVVQAAVNIKTIPPTDTTVTNAQGVYTLVGIPAGQFTVVAEKAGFIRAFKDVLVVSNRTSSADLEIFPATGSGFVAGQVIDGAFGLELVQVDTTPATQTVITTADGRYTLNGPPGEYVVQARRNGYSTERRNVRILEGRTVTQDFALGARSDGVLSGQVTDQTGAALQLARVDLFQGTEIFTAFTDTAGNYGFLNLTTGFYVISVEAPSFLPGSKGLEIRGGTSNNGDIVLYLTSTPAPVPGSITGTVRDQDDLPVAGITLTLSVAANPVSALTQADGRYTFVDVPPGSVTIMANQLAPPPGGPIFAPASRVVTVGAAQTADGDLALQKI